MFKIGSGRFTWMAVRWPGLTEDGTPLENEVELQVELVTRTRLQEQLDAEKAGGTSDKFASEVTRNWKGVGDADGNPLPFSLENFALLFDAPGFGNHFGSAYLEAWQGISGIREKNSDPSPGAGPKAGAPSPKPAP